MLYDKITHHTVNLNIKKKRKQNIRNIKNMKIKIEIKKGNKIKERHH